MKNFYSIGNITQKVTVQDQTTTLIMGDNVDYGDSESGTIRNGVGKAQPLSAKIRVANGWKTMGDIKVGDIVMTPEGGSAVVMGKYPQGTRKVYEIKTADDKTTRACKEHLWELYDGSVVDTFEIYTMLKNKVPVYLPTSVSQMDNYRKIDVDPYIVGLVLSCGVSTLVDGTQGILLPVYDSEVLKRISHKHNYTVTSKGLIVSDYDLEVLLKMFSFENGYCVPTVDLTEYDYDTRMGILTAFFDTSVDISAGGDYYTGLEAIVSCSTSARAIKELIWSVGGICKNRVLINANVSKNTSELQQSKYNRLTISVPNVSTFFTFEKFEFDRVKGDVKNQIVSISNVGEEPVCCIKISSDRQLYITDSYIPTHNTTVINAISYALFGDTITKPKKKAAIINYFNGKELLVTLRFQVDGVEYLIERGQKPSVMRFVRFNSDGTEEDLAQGSTSNTDAYIASTIGMSHLLCKYIMLMSTYAEPFMNEDAAKQRAIIEELLGIGELSEKAELIKEKEKFYSIELEKEQVRIKTVIESNNRVERAIADLVQKSNAWELKRKDDIRSINTEIEVLSNINILEEIEKHKENVLIKESNNTITLLENEKNKLDRVLNEYQQVMLTKNDKLEKVKHLGVCHECKQTLGAVEAANQEKQLLVELQELFNRYDTESKILSEINVELSKIEYKQPHKTFYKNVEQAYEHEKVLGVLESELKTTMEKINPYEEQVASLQQTDYGVQEIDYSKVEEFEKILKHYKFLKKLLTHKDSFLRKVIINRSLPFLNSRLRYYLDFLSLPHHVVFDADLTFNITHMGVDSDYSILSRGEQNRITYALNLSFRDLFENTRKEINVLFVDELLDFGVDSTGAIAGLQILKNIAHNGRSTFLVTHKEELIERVPNIIYVKKENGFTTYNEEGK